MPGTKIWNKDLITRVFNDEAWDVISNIQIVNSDEPVKLAGTPAPTAKGKCTSKEAFRFIRN